MAPVYFKEDPLPTQANISLPEDIDVYAPFLRGEQLESYELSNAKRQREEEAMAAAVESLTQGTDPAQVYEQMAPQINLYDYLKNEAQQRTKSIERQQKERDQEISRLTEIDKINKDYNLGLGPDTDLLEAKRYIVENNIPKATKKKEKEPKIEVLINPKTRETVTVAEESAESLLKRLDGYIPKSGIASYLKPKNEGGGMDDWNQDENNKEIDKTLDLPKETEARRQMWLKARQERKLP